MTVASKHNSERFIIASPVLLATATLLLVFIIGVFAVNNYQREKKLMHRGLMQEGRAILNLTSSSSRAAMRSLVMRADFNRQHWLDALQEVVQDGAEHQRIRSLLLVDANGVIIAHNRTELVGTPLDRETRLFLEQDIKPPRSHNGRVVTSADSTRLFQVAATFSPMGGRNESVNQPHEGWRGRMMRRMHESRAGGETALKSNDLLRQSYFLVAELDMTEFTSQVRQQFVFILVLSVVLLLVGVGGLLSLTAIQGFRGSQQKLKTITAFTDVLVSSMPLGIVSLELSGTIHSMNQSSRNILGLQGDYRGKHYRDVFPEELLAGVTSLLDTTESVKDLELALSEASQEKTVHLICVVIESEHNDEASHMFLFQDLTKQKSLERELRRNERHTALGKMAAGVAHELRNPLSSIKGLALLLRAKFTDRSAGWEEADLLVSEVNRLDRSISELLDYAKPGSLQLSQVSLGETIHKAIQLIRSDAQSQGVEIRVFHEDETMCIDGDQDKLIQLFLNLFLNGLQAMKEGGSLEIKTSQIDNRVQIVVSDTGHGVAAQIKDRLFDPYFTTKNEGTGLGLSLCAKIVEDHRGTIQLESMEGEGTVVSVTLTAQEQGSLG